MQVMGASAWHATAEDLTHDEATKLLEDHGSFAKADRMFEAIERGVEPEGFEAVDVEELYRRFA